MVIHVVVLGAGVVGLSTAVNVQSILPNAKVTIVADKFDQETTSDGAAGIFRPNLELTPAKSSQQARKWLEDSFDWFDRIWQSDEGPEAGVIRVSGYQLMNEKVALPIHRHMDYGFSVLSTEQLQRLPVGKRYKYGWWYDTLMVECRRYLPWLMKRFRTNGGYVICQRVTSLSEIPVCDVTVNCLGWGSRQLFGDDDMFPVRGHTLRVNAPWVKQFYVLGNGDHFIYPGQDDVTLGVTREVGQTELDYIPETFNRIRGICQDILPSLKDACEVRRWVGIRPHRHDIRLEKEAVKVDGRTIQIIHNYGHGANGVCFSWGTALDAARMAVDHVKVKTSKL
ncbi:D-aspartate oxidase-like [Ylistrum balloti]|uniref:D-aspartate oxidase-like n=1 Tax=Ylistrum balloti TaxID=509963 RepID=UPI00290590D8|nr:D-aspartate oxidase-like [Ylistrum balloti]